MDFSELFGVHGLVVAVVALVVIGPKDLPKAMRVVGYWVGKARGVARQFRSGFDQMVREAELEEMEKKWKAENERIMREHPPLPDHDSANHDSADHGIPAARDGSAATAEPGPPMLPLNVEKPVIVTAAATDPAPSRDGAPS